MREMPHPNVWRVGKSHLAIIDTDNGESVATNDWGFDATAYLLTGGKVSVIDEHWQPAYVWKVDSYWRRRARAETMCDARAALAEKLIEEMGGPLWPT